MVLAGIVQAVEKGQENAHKLCYCSSFKDCSLIKILGNIRNYNSIQKLKQKISIARQHFLSHLTLLTDFVH